jgi:hypothetical protein
MASAIVAPITIRSRDHRVAGEMRISVRCRRLGMPEQLAENRQTEPAPRTDAGESVAQIMDAQARQPSGLGHGIPPSIEIGAVLPPTLTGNEVRVVLKARETGQDRKCRCVQVERLAARFGVGQVDNPPLEIDVLPSRMEGSRGAVHRSVPKAGSPPRRTDQYRFPAGQRRGVPAHRSTLLISLDPARRVMTVRNHPLPPSPTDKRHHNGLKPVRSIRRGAHIEVHPGDVCPGQLGRRERTVSFPQPCQRAAMRLRRGRLAMDGNMLALERLDQLRDRDGAPTARLLGLRVGASPYPA